MTIKASTATDAANLLGEAFNVMKVIDTSNDITDKLHDVAIALKSKIDTETVGHRSRCMGSFLQLIRIVLGSGYD